MEILEIWSKVLKRLKESRGNLAEILTFPWVRAEILIFPQDFHGLYSNIKDLQDFHGSGNPRGNPESAARFPSYYHGGFAGPVDF